MAKELTTISPEGMEIANSYLQFGNIRAVSDELRVSEEKVAEPVSYTHLTLPTTPYV